MITTGGGSLNGFLSSRALYALLDFGDSTSAIIGLIASRPRRARSSIILGEGASEAGVD